MNDDFCAFILTHGRPDNVLTYKNLRRCGYTGKIYIVIDDEDKTRSRYIDKFKNEVLVFSKDEISKHFDEGDNFSNRKVIVYARNACFQLAEQVGCKYFIQLDDDYSRFCYRTNDNREYGQWLIKDLDAVFSLIIDYYKSTNAKTIAFAQGGDLIGGKESESVKTIKTKRKAMNSFICSTDRPFTFFGRINEDVNTYVTLGRRGDLFLSLMFLTLTQQDSQTRSGGMTETYLDSGTYVKSFYTVMFSPSCSKISVINSLHPRIHHKISWNNAVPCILDEKNRKY